MNEAPARNRTHRAIRKTLALVVMIGLALTSLAQIDRAEADALSSFDAQLLSLINEHRTGLGLNPLVEYVPLSEAAMNWSNGTLARRNAISGACPSPSFQYHDSGANIGSQGVPPGTTGSGETLAWACGSPGVTGNTGFTYGALPAKCRGALDFTTALMAFCQWINSPSHRPIIESPNFDYIGLGTTFKRYSGLVEPMSTARFAAAPPGASGPTCGGLIVTINMNENGGNGNGTGGDDVILGTPGDDVIRGYGGNDTICGEAGRDYIYAGGDEDVVYGGDDIDRIWGDAGHDVIYGDGGSDRIRGGSGSDTVHAGSGADRVWGGPGHDTLNGMGGQDRMWGEDGNDTMQGNHQSDWLYGGPGNDGIYAAAGKDKIYGEGGNDDMNGGENTDYLDGGPGTDVANGGRGKDNPVVANVSGCIAETRISC